MPLFKNNMVLHKAPRLLLATLLALAALEGLLRMGGLFTAPKLSAPASEDSNRRSVLCAGDSFVYGIGGESFPKQLEGMLNKRQRLFKFTVYNAGVPGSGTSEMLSKLEGQLRTYAPDYLIILSGANNSWLQFDLSSPQKTNPLARLKLWKFMRLLLRPQKPDANTAVPPADCKSSFPSENDWFAAQRMNLSAIAGTLPQAPRALQDYARRIEQDFKNAELLISQRTTEPAAQQLRKLLASRPPAIPEGERARETAARMLELTKFRAAVLLGHLYYFSNRTESINSFETALRLRPDYLYGHFHIASICRISGDAENFHKHIKLILDKDPSFIPAYIELIWHHYRRAEYPLSSKYLARALALAPCSEHTLTHLPFTYPELADLLLPLGKSIPGLKNNPAYIRHARLARRIKELGDNEKAMENLTEDDILSAGRLAKRYKAKLFISSYPERSLAGVERAAVKLNVPYIDFVTLFKADFKDRAEYIAFDNDHCNRDGYRFMAERFAELILSGEAFRTRQQP